MKNSMRSQQSEFEETPYYKAIRLPDKDKWVAYFRIIYNEKDIEQERFTHESRAKILASAGLRGDDVLLCVNGLNSLWNDLLNGFFRHYHSMVYTELCMALHTYSGLVDMQMAPAKDQKEQKLKVDGLEDFKRVRQLINTLSKELYNGRHLDMGNIVLGTALFKGTRIEKNATDRTKNRLTSREAADDEYE